MASSSSNDIELLGKQSFVADQKPTKEKSAGSDKEKSDIFEIIGNNGFWQFRVFLVLFMISIPGTGQNLVISFMAPNIDYWCARPSEGLNISVEQWKKLLPKNDKHCSRYSNLTFPLNGTFNISGFSTLPCESWEYDHSFYTSTILEEFNLVCDREWFISFTKSVFMGGLLVSVLFFGHLSDRIGRRPTITGCSILSFISSVLCTFSTSFTMFLVGRFFVAVGVGGYYNNLFVLMLEVVGPHLRNAYSNAVQLGWTVGFVCLPGIAWLIRDWFWMQLALTAPYIIFLGVWWMIPESPRWLLTKGKTEQAKEILSEAVKMNKRNVSDLEQKIKKIIDSDKDGESQNSKGNMFDLVRTPSLRKITLNIVFTWFVISFIYFGLSFNTNDLAGDPFVNFAASGVVEFPAYGFAILAIKYFGRRKPLAATMTMGGLMCLLSYFIPKNPTWLSLIFPMIGRFCIISCYGIVYVFTLELFPTVVRSSGLRLANFFEQIGSIIAPFVRELGIATQPYVPFIVFGILACMSGLLSLLLPETTDKKMPDTVREAAAMQEQRNTH